MMRKVKRKFGFTLIELVVVMAILSVVASIAGWGANAMIPVFRIRSASMELKSDMQLARLQAIRHNTFVVSHIDEKKSIYTIFSDDGGGDNTKAHNYVKDDGEKVFKEVRLHPHIKIMKAKFGIDEGRFAFNSRGALDGLAGGIYLQHRNNIFRGVAISRIGKITIKRSTDGKNWYAQD